MFGRSRRSAQGTERQLVGPGGAPKPEINSTGKQASQRPKLLSDDVGSMVGKHDAAGADADGFRSCRDMADHDRCCSARNPRHVVVLRYPDSAIAPRFGMDRDISGIVECTARVGVLRYPDEIEDG